MVAWAREAKKKFIIYVSVLIIAVLAISVFAHAYCQLHHGLAIVLMLLVVVSVVSLLLVLTSTPSVSFSPPVFVGAVNQNVIKAPTYKHTLGG